MRYQNWDVLMFPNELCKIPLQEFKTSCQVVQDPEVHQSQGAALLLPTVTCFVPSLPAGESFRISIHSWQNPEASRYIHQISSRHAENVLFEARVFVDGRIASTKLFHRNGPWPTVLETSVEIDKQGDYKKLEFPAFHRELLSQSYWNPGDDLGRVKVVVSEGVPRDNLSMPFERIKNLVAFSFQHAPLDVLEASSIAWPNATMWRQVSLVAPFYTQHSSPKRVEEDREAHAHSPRKPPAVEFMSSQTNSMPPPPPSFSKSPNFDPFTSESTRPFPGWRRQGTSTDTSMPDLPSNSSEQAGSTRNVSDPMVIEKAFRNNDMQSTGAYESLCEALLPPVPDNTPQNESEVTLVSSIALRQPSMQRGPSRPCIDRVPTPRALGAPDTPEGLVSQIEEGRFLYSRRLSSSSLSCAKGNKENSSRSPGGQAEIIGSNNQRNTSGSSTRRSSHLFTSTNVMGTKRQRNVTPASSKAIDDEDEPRSSPSLRKASRQSNASGHSRGKDSERAVLSAVDNI
ncbi:hypothetical protein SS1G_14270 [Sclerotinia sclerotiorum 1980 UF-70]|uniref:Uncharacterized protein n=2 Tax=Sclerotinia sclerotiorum (strain ATCC 18683 / 1980 / Ss-1) TaxID=665079 RepID=A7F9I9_SCLS1|nr:hypothetical protein SS1G_14270 [Sclerotinia sclerotiorum 1980 UF-70]APA09213.1 hypothetical protein sscle_04g039830 [Sclerotinia sclerotiorum 1980 UF-70]EDO00400.1 hypothetical protein SS1G_14270 [Sclerotinia sclerotiorum 1980 UF-70]